MSDLKKHYYAYDDGINADELQDCIIQECESAGLIISYDEDLSKDIDRDHAFTLENPYKEKLKTILNICDINAKQWNEVEHDPADEFKKISKIIREGLEI